MADLQGASVDELRERWSADVVTRHTNSLKKARRLALVFDLDHTILHSTDLHARYLPELRNREECFVFQQPSKQTVIRVRPHLRTLLDAIKDRYVCFVYTAGSTAYAQCILEHIDPRGEWFGTAPLRRIISRDHFPDDYENKRLHRCFPVSPDLVLVLDDKKECWDIPQSVLQIMQFRYWPEPLLQQKDAQRLWSMTPRALYGTGVRDDVLLSLTPVLTAVHDLVYGQANGLQTAPEALDFLRRQVLHGTKLRFTGFRNDAAFHGLARALGARCGDDSGEDTHVVAVRDDSVVAEARQNDLNVVFVNWFLESRYHFRRAPEAIHSQLHPAHDTERRLELAHMSAQCRAPLLSSETLVQRVQSLRGHKAQSTPVQTLETDLVTQHITQWPFKTPSDEALIEHYLTGDAAARAAASVKERREAELRRRQQKMAELAASVLGGGAAKSKEEATTLADFLADGRLPGLSTPLTLHQLEGFFL